MHHATASLLLCWCCYQPPRKATFFPPSLQHSSTCSTVLRLNNVSLQPSLFILPSSCIASLSLLSSLRCMRRYANFCCFFHSPLVTFFFPFFLHHFSMHHPRAACVVCILSTSPLYISLAGAACSLHSPETSDSRRNRCCWRKTFCHFLALARTIAFPRPILTCACSCLCVLCAAVFPFLLHCLHRCAACAQTCSFCSLPGYSVGHSLIRCAAATSTCGLCYSANSRAPQSWCAAISLTSPADSRSILPSAHSLSRTRPSSSAASCGMGSQIQVRRQ